MLGLLWCEKPIPFGSFEDYKQFFDANSATPSVLARFDWKSSSLLSPRTRGAQINYPPPPILPLESRHGQPPTMSKHPATSRLPAPASATAYVPAARPRGGLRRRGLLRSGQHPPPQAALQAPVQGRRVVPCRAPGGDLPPRGARHATSAISPCVCRRSLMNSTLCAQPARAPKRPTNAAATSPWSLLDSVLPARRGA
jgi:hypothetical protein